MAAQSRMHDKDEISQALDDPVVSSSALLAHPSMGIIADFFGGGCSLALPTSNATGYASRVHNADDDLEPLEEPIVPAGTWPADPLMLSYFGGDQVLVPHIGGVTGYAAQDDLETALTLGYHAQQTFNCDLWPHCQKRFSERKSLYRHMRMKHFHSGVAEFPCPHPECGLSFARQDILKRHTKSQHSEEEPILCNVCNKFVRRRSVPAHQRSMKHRKAQARAFQYITTENLRRYTERPPTPNYLDAITDPVLLSAWAFIKLKPWGHTSRRMMNFATAPEVPIKVSIEYLTLRDQVSKSLLHYLSCEPAVRDAALPDALAIMGVVDSITGDFEAGMYHARALVRLGFAQLSSWSNAQQWLQSEPSVEAFETATTKGVSSEARQSSQNVIRMLVKLMRRATVEIMFMPFQDLDLPVWDRVDHLTHDDWVGNYRQELLAIISLAESIELE